MPAEPKEEKNSPFLTTSRLNNITPVFSPAELEQYLQTQQLQKFERLSRKSSIAFLFDKGKTFTVYPFKLTWTITDTAQFPISVLFSVTKKNFPCAVDRNRVKRLMREAYRKNKHQAIHFLSQKNLNLFLAILFTGKSIPDYTETETKIKAALKKLVDEITASNT
jgi:ribonuclease P protein component